MRFKTPKRVLDQTKRGGNFNSDNILLRPPLISLFGDEWIQLGDVLWKNGKGWKTWRRNPNKFSHIKIINGSLIFPEEITGTWVDTEVSHARPESRFVLSTVPTKSLVRNRPRAVGKGCK